MAQGRCVVTREEMRRWVADHPLDWPPLSAERRERLAALFAPAVARAAESNESPAKAVAQAAAA